MNDIVTFNPYTMSLSDYFPLKISYYTKYGCNTVIKAQPVPYVKIPVTFAAIRCLALFDMKMRAQEDSQYP